MVLSASPVTNMSCTRSYCGLSDILRSATRSEDEEDPPDEYDSTISVFIGTEVITTKTATRCRPSRLVLVALVLVAIAGATLWVAQRKVGNENETSRDSRAQLAPQTLGPVATPVPTNNLSNLSQPTFAPSPLLQASETYSPIQTV